MEENSALRPFDQTNYLLQLELTDWRRFQSATDGASRSPAAFQVSLGDLQMCLTHLEASVSGA